MPWQGGDFPCVATGSAGNSQDDRIIHQQKKKTGSTCVSATCKKLFGFAASESWKVLTSKDSNFTLPKKWRFQCPNAPCISMYITIIPLFTYKTGWFMGEMLEHMPALWFASGMDFMISARARRGVTRAWLLLARRWLGFWVSGWVIPESP